MKKGFILLFVFLFFCFIYTNTDKASANIFNAINYINPIKPFGGKIIWTKALSIEKEESSGKFCIMEGGSSITIKPIGSHISTPIEYYIPIDVKPKTKTSTGLNKFILGNYGETKTIMCCIELLCTPVTLNTIKMFGTSR